MKEIVNILSLPAIMRAKTVIKPGAMNGMHGGSGALPLGSTFFLNHTKSFKMGPSLFKQFFTLKCTYKIFIFAEIKI